MSVLRDWNYLAASPVEQIAVLAAFLSAPDAALPLVPSVVVTDGVLIALADDIIVCLALISEIDQPVVLIMFVVFMCIVESY